VIEWLKGECQKAKGEEGMRIYIGNAGTPGRKPMGERNAFTVGLP